MIQLSILSWSEEFERWKKLLNEKLKVGVVQNRVFQGVIKNCTRIEDFNSKLQRRYQLRMYKRHRTYLFY